MNRNSPWCCTRQPDMEHSQRSAPPGWLWFLFIVAGLGAGWAPWTVQGEEPTDPLIARSTEHIQKGRYEEAREVLDLLAGDEELPAADAIHVWLLRTRLEEETGNLQAALSVAEEAIQQHGQSPALWARRAELDWRSGKPQSAQTHVQRALDLNSQDLSARLLAAHLTAEAGRVEEALEQYRWFVRHYNRTQPADSASLVLIAQGAAEYARWQTVPEIFKFIVNTLAPDALTADPNCWQAHVISGELLLEKYNREQAVPEFHKALKINPLCVAALTGLANSSLADYSVDDADGFADKALAVQSNYLPALLVKIDTAIYRNELALAGERVEAALQISSLNQLVLARRFVLELLAESQLSPGELTAALKHGLTGEGKEPVTAEWLRTFQRVVEANSRPGKFLAAAGELLESRRRLDQAEALYRLAIEVMPQLSSPRTALGMLCMQNGRTEEAEQILEAAFKSDPFHVRVSNMRKVLGVLKEYQTISTEHFVIRIDAGEKVLAREMAEYLESIYAELTDRYQFEPPVRTQFEVYSDAKGQPAHAWFSARMIGLPWIQTIGASTGMIVALASPTKTENRYNWARVLRHEFVHILTLQKTQFQIPHWYTEALAVTEERMAMPDQWQALLLQRVPENRVFQLSDINSGFQRPNTQNDWHLAYCQSWLYGQYITQRFGDDGLTRLLDSFRSTTEPAVALKDAFQIDLVDFEQGYSDLLRERTAALRGTRPDPAPSLKSAEDEAARTPGDVMALARLAHAQLAARRWQSASETATKVLQADPENLMAQTVTAATALADRNAERAVEILDVVIVHDDCPPLALELRAGMARRQDDNLLAEKILNRLMERFPADTGYQSDLLEVAEKLGRDDLELLDVLENLASVESDNAAVRKRLARAAVAQQHWPDAVRWAEQAIYIDVEDEAMHRLLAVHASSMGRADRAIRSWLALIDLQQASLADRIELAKLYIQVGKRDSARQVLRDILAEDSTYQAARSLLQPLDRRSNE